MMCQRFPSESTASYRRYPQNVSSSSVTIRAPLADRALVVHVDFVNVKVEHGRGLGCLTRAVLSLGRVSPADHHEAITEAEPSHGASVRVVQPSLLSKAECAGQKLQRGSLVGVDKAKLQPFGCWLPLTEILQWLHEVPAVAFGIDRFVVTVTPRCVFEGSADHGTAAVARWKCPSMSSTMTFTSAVGLPV